eukprot:m.137543 g.137543  ORF g.137543 m.137543 type:complete len:338 (+) comp52508_c0_seq1:103-1116(+)
MAARLPRAHIEHTQLQLSINVEIRPLHESDFDKNFTELLQQLSTVGSISPAFFHSRLSEFRRTDMQTMVVAEDMSLGRICGSGTLMIEPKFIRNAGLVGHLEDLVVDIGLRRKGIGAAIVKLLLQYAKQMSCYKVILDCSEANVPFYEKCGFKRKDASLVRYIDLKTDIHFIAGKSLEEVLQPCMFDKYRIRVLEPSDYSGNFLKLLEQLTVVGDVSRSAFDERFRQIKTEGNQHVIVLEEPATDDRPAIVLATATLFIEQKFIREAGLAGHIEDVVVDKSLRGKGMGRVIIDKLQEIAIAAKCYKIILDCAPNNVAFYEKCGFSLGHSPVCMAHYF